MIHPIRLCLIALGFALTPLAGVAAEPAVVFDENGTAHIVNLKAPIPDTISEPAREMLRAAGAAGDPTEGLSRPVPEIREMLAPIRAARTEEMLRQYPSTVERKTLAGVPVALVTPAKSDPEAGNRLLINVHGGAFQFGQGSITEAIPIAARTGIPVLAIDYRLAPEHPFPAAVDDTIAVYRALLESHAPEHMALYGSSAGAVLTAQAGVRAMQLNLPLPAAFGFFSGTVDFARIGDTEALFSMTGFAPVVAPIAVQAAGYLADNDLTDPVMSPAYADVTGFPPTLLLTGTRDFFLSGTANFHRQLLAAGVEADLVVYDAMPHVHWSNPGLPESEEALDLQARFLKTHVMAAD